MRQQGRNYWASVASAQCVLDPVLHADVFGGCPHLAMCARVSVCCTLPRAFWIRGSCIFKLTASDAWP